MAPTTGNDRECSPCEKGRFQSKESHEETLCVVHTPCSAGKYQEGALCNERPCLRGMPCGSVPESFNHSETECVKCPKGTYLRDPSEDDSSKHDELGDCKDCTAKTYNPTMGLDRVCFPCSTQLVPGGTECGGCDPGKFKESNTNCTVCQPGRFSSEPDLTECDECPRGYYGRNASLEVLRDCGVCERGTFGMAKGARDITTGCQNCFAGRFSEVEGLAVDDGKPADTACKGCPRGRWSNETGLDRESRCLNCDPGRYGLLEVGAQSIESCRACDAVSSQ